MKSQLVREEGLFSHNDLCVDENLESWIILTESLIQEQNYKKAEDCIRMALSMSPHCEKLWLELGNLLQEMKQFSEAEKCFSEVIKINPNDKEAQKNLNSLITRQS